MWLTLLSTEAESTVTYLQSPAGHGSGAEASIVWLDLVCLLCILLRFHIWPLLPSPCGLGAPVEVFGTGFASFSHMLAQN